MLIKPIRHRLIAIAITIILAATLLSTAGAGPARGRLDRRFGPSGDGIAAVHAGGHEFATSVSALDGGRILIAGPSPAAHQTPAHRVALSVLDRNGIPDRSFGRRGVKTVKVNGDGYAIPVLASPGARIVIADAAGDGLGFRLRRFRDDGSPDDTFGDHGSATFSDGVLRGGTSAAVQRNGSILVLAGPAVSATWTGPYAAAATLTRILPDGRVDAGFGLGGRTEPLALLWPGAGLTPTIVATDRADTIYVAGLSWAGLNPARPFVARFAADGTPDPTFGMGGIALGPASAHWVEGIQPTADGDVLLASSDMTSETVTRFEPDGTPRSSFGSGGSSRYEPMDGEAVVGITTTRRSGYILVTLRYDCYYMCAGTLVAYRSDGSLDRSFGREGRATVPMETMWSARLIGPWIYTAGGSKDLDADHDLALARVRA